MVQKEKVETDKVAVVEISPKTLSEDYILQQIDYNKAF